MPKLPQPCLTCGIVQTNGSRCLPHAQQSEAKRMANRKITKEQTGQYSGSYKRLAAIVRATAKVCHLCGIPFQPGDQIHADHLTPGTPVYDISQLAPAHAACNTSRGSKPLQTP